MIVTPARADPAAEPTTSQLLDAFKAASGGVAWDAVSTITLKLSVKDGGLSGVDIQSEDVALGKYVARYTIGPVSGAEGYDGSQSWITDASGRSRYLTSDDDKRTAATNSYLVSLSLWYPTRRHAALSAPKFVEEGAGQFDVVTVSPDGGNPVDLWFDRTSHMVVRTVVTTASHAVTTDYSDFRKTGGVLLAYKLTTSTGNAGSVSTSMLTDAKINSLIPPNSFSPAPTCTLDYVIAGNAPSATVPFEYLYGHIYVPVTINGHGPFDAILDSGGRLGLTPQFAKENNIGFQGKFPGTGTGPTTVNEGIAVIQNIKIGAVSLSNQLALVLPMPTPSANPLIGAELFKRFAVTLDFDKLLLTLTPLTTYQNPKSDTSVPFQFIGDIPVVDAAIDGIDGKFMIDTGSGNSVILYPHFVQQFGLEAKYKPPFLTSSGYGVGGTQSATIARASTFSLGKPSLSANNVLIYLSNATSGAFSDASLAGDVGMGFLHKFNMTFNYDRQTIVFTPNSHLSEPDAYERLGISFDATPTGCVVDAVIPGSPAAVAGLVVGDIITVVNGRKLGVTDEGWLFDQLYRQAGTTLTLDVKRGKHTLVMAATLKDLI